MKMDGCERVVVLIDMDCFYVQVEQRRQPEIKGKPCAVVQYNKWKGGGIIAVSYEARAKGVSRNMRGDDAKEKCPDIVLCMVPTANGKADLTRYRDAGAEVIQVLLQFSGIVERASIDEAYIDLTDVVNERMLIANHSSNRIPSLSEMQHTYIVGYPQSIDSSSTKSEEQTSGINEYSERASHDENAIRLLIAAALLEEIRLAIFEQTTFRCSAGISHNKVLAKLACGINKPNKQTILPMESVSELFKQVKIGKIRNLGGKLGQQLSENQNIEYIGQVAEIPKAALVKAYGAKTGEWLSEICRGIDREAVKERHVVQSVGCSKTFRGADALDTRTKVKHWIDCLATELVERLTKDREMNNRSSRSLTCHIGLHEQKSVSRACQISKYEVEDISRCIMATLELLNQSKDRQSDAWYPAITMIGISAGKFQNINGQSLLQLNTEKSSINNSAFSSTSKYFNLEKKAKKERKNEVEESLPNEDQSSLNESKRTTLFNTNCESSTHTKLSPIKRCKSPRTNKSTAMDRKRLFFTQNFGVADKVHSSSSFSAAEEKVENHRQKEISNKKVLTTKNLTEKKRSFFARMKENSTKESSACKIESAFEELTNVEKDSGKIDCTSCPPSVQPALNEIKHEETSDSSFDMDNVDMEVFNSLPLYLQQEIKFASRKSALTTAGSNMEQNCMDSKRRKLASVSGQTSISGFFNSPEKQVKNSNKKSSSKKDKAKSRKGTDSLRFSCLEENVVPFGFFRARSQASAAIRNAVEKQALQSQKRKEERVHSEL